MSLAVMRKKRFGTKALALCENIRRSRLESALVSIVIASVIFALFMLLPPVIGEDDDWAISQFLSGLHPDDGYALFISSELSHFVSWLFSLLPNGPNYYLLLELLASCSAYAFIIYLSIRHFPGRMTIALVFAIAALMVPLCTYKINFTVVTCMLMLAGCLALLIQMIESRATLSISILAIGFVVLAFLFRKEAAYLCLPCMALFLICYIYNCLAKEAFFSVGAIVPIVISGILVVALLGYSAFEWSSPELKSWEEYNSARSLTSDFPTRQYSDIEGDLTKIGMSENDYWLVLHWVTNDPGFFTTEKLQEISDIATIKPSLSATAFAISARNYITSVISRPLIGAIVIGICCVVFSLVRRSSRKQKIFILLGFLTSFAISVYFTAIGYLPDRVEYTVWMYFILFCFAMLGMGRDNLEFRNYGGFDRGLASAGVTILACMALATVAPILNEPSLIGAKAILGKNFEKSSEAIQYQLSNDDVVYAFDMSASRARERLYYTRAIPSSEAESITYVLGGWGTGAQPLLDGLMAKAGTNNIMQGMAQGDDIVYVTTKRDTEYLERIHTYLKEHYNQTVSRELIASIDDTPTGSTFEFYRFHPSYA